MSQYADVSSLSMLLQVATNLSIGIGQRGSLGVQTIERLLKACFLTRAAPVEKVVRWELVGGQPDTPVIECRDVKMEATIQFHDSAVVVYTVFTEREEVLIELK